MEVLINASLFCMQLGGGGCLDDGTGKPFNATWDDSKVWVFVDVAAGKKPNEVRRQSSAVNAWIFRMVFWLKCSLGSNTQYQTMCGTSFADGGCLQCAKPQHR